MTTPSAPSRLGLHRRPAPAWWGKYRHLAGALGALLLVFMLLPPVRHFTESSMSLHMLLQYPARLCAGARLAAALPRRGSVLQQALQRCNELGLAGLLLAALTMAVLMVPRLLDLALVDARVESLKLLALVCSGAALALSWQRAGTVVQAFFLGNVLPMLAVVGTLYQDSTVRLCNAYLLDDQQTLGQALVWAAAGILALWLVHLAVTFRGHGSAGRARRAAVTPRA